MLAVEIQAKACTGIQGWLLQGTFCCPLLWVASATVHPSSFLPSSCSCCLSQATCSLPYLQLPLDSCARDIPFHFFGGFFLSFLSSSVYVSLHVPLMRQTGALQSCPLEAMRWWPASFCYFSRTAGTELLVATCPDLWPHCLRLLRALLLWLIPSMDLTRKGSYDGRCINKTVLCWQKWLWESQVLFRAAYLKKAHALMPLLLGAVTTVFGLALFKIMSQRHHWNW